MLFMVEDNEQLYVNQYVIAIVPGPPNIIGACNSLVEQTSLI